VQFEGRRSTTTSLAENLRIDNPATGHASLHRLDWDSEFFRSTFGFVDEVEVLAGVTDRAAAVRQLLDDLACCAASEGFAHLTYRPPVNDWSVVHGVGQAGWLLVDVGLDFLTRQFEFTEHRVSSTIRPARDDDLPALRDLAATAFVHSRFAADSFFSEAQVEAFHRQWVTNLHNGLAQALLVSEDAADLTGFISCALSGSTGRIPLIAVKDGRRGTGIGKQLVQAALGWFAASGAIEVRVKTQAANTAAVDLYERSRFVLERLELTFTKDLRDRSGKEMR
jgi:dTDP-4-amino-4,6-dideoxy-D-galactose acyltransferase